MEPRATKWHSDDRMNGPFSSADGEWTATDWRPRAIRAGWRRWAVVLPEQVFGQTNMRRQIAHVSESGLTIRTFIDPAEAVQCSPGRAAFI